MTNEAAERLRTYARKTWRTDTPKGQERGEHRPQGQFLADLDQALADERRDTVERIRTASLATAAWGPNLAELTAILDAEAKR